EGERSQLGRCPTCVGSARYGERAFSVSEYSAFRAGIFKASRTTDPMRIWKPRKEQVPALPFIVSISSPDYSSAWMLPRIARFRFARQDHCNSTTSIRLNFRLARDTSGSRHNVDRMHALVIILRAVRLRNGAFPVSNSSLTNNP